MITLKMGIFVAIIVTTFIIGELCGIVTTALCSANKINYKNEENLKYDEFQQQG